MEENGRRLPTPQEASERLSAAGENEAVALIEAMVAELATVRAERDALADFTRSISHLRGSEMSINASLTVQAKKALDALRVTERCPRPVGRGDDRHRWMRADPVFGSRCFSCNARRPGT